MYLLSIQSWIVFALLVGGFVFVFLIIATNASAGIKTTIIKIEKQKRKCMSAGKH